MDTKFKEAIKAVEPVNLEGELSKIGYKDELKKGEENDTPSRQSEQARPLLTRQKNFKKAKGDASLQATVIATKAVLNRSRKAKLKVQE